MTFTQITLRHLSFVALSVATTVGITMALIRVADALFSGSPIDLATIALMAIAMACGLGAWSLRRL
jgi:hypothetical protein